MTIAKFTSRTSRNRIMGLAVASAVGMAAPAFAQSGVSSMPGATTAPSAATSPPASAPMTAGQTKAGTGAASTTTRSPGLARVDQYITQMHARLQITPAEQTQWDAFAQAMRDDAQKMDTLYQQRSEQFATMSAVDGLKSYADIEQAHVDGLQHLVSAFVPLYGAMTPAQQKNADAVFRYQGERAQARRTQPAAPKSQGTGTQGTGAHG